MVNKACAIVQDKFKKEMMELSPYQILEDKEYKIDIVSNPKYCDSGSKEMLFFYEDIKEFPSFDQFENLKSVEFWGGSVKPDGNKINFDNLFITANINLERFENAQNANLKRLEVITTNMKESFVNDISKLPDNIKLNFAENDNAIKCKNGGIFGKGTVKDLKKCL